MSANLTARLIFLTDAAHLLAKSAPETSSYLMSRRTSLMLENDRRLSDVERQRLCTSCGHILIPGQGEGDSVRHETQKYPKGKGKKKPKTDGEARRRRQEAGGRGTLRIFHCGTCGRDTVVPMPAPAPIVRKHSQAAAAPEVPERKPATANASSKKRAKARRDGLAALLRDAAAASTARPGLSLADFMKTD